MMSTQNNFIDLALTADMPCYAWSPSPADLPGQEVITACNSIFGNNKADSGVVHNNCAKTINNLEGDKTFSYEAHEWLILL
jgi:hypothetical protein